MIFEEALKKMREGYTVGLEGSLEDDIYRIKNGEIEEYRGDDEWVSAVWIRTEQILSNMWYERRE